jgi:hypothetical protein
MKILFIRNQLLKPNVAPSHVVYLLYKEYAILIVNISDWSDL